MLIPEAKMRRQKYIVSILLTPQLNKLFLAAHSEHSIIIQSSAPPPIQKTLSHHHKEHHHTYSLIPSFVRRQNKKKVYLPSLAPIMNSTYWGTRDKHWLAPSMRQHKYFPQKISITWNWSPTKHWVRRTPKRPWRRTIRDHARGRWTTTQKHFLLQHGIKFHVLIKCRNYHLVLMKLCV